MSYMRGIFIFFVFLSVSVWAQDEPIGPPVTLEKSVQGDSLVTVWLQPVDISMSRRAYRRYVKKYNRLTRYVKKVYPYARLASEIINDYERMLDTIPTERAKKKLMAQAEEELRDEFEEKLKKFTFTQGRILIKLIDRETGQTTYQLIRNLRGGFSAFMWQGIAKLFGSDLKTEYDPEEEIMIEQIIRQIENGNIPTYRIIRKSDPRWQKIKAKERKV